MLIVPRQCPRVTGALQQPEQNEIISIEATFCLTLWVNHQRGNFLWLKSWTAFMLQLRFE